MRRIQSTTVRALSLLVAVMFFCSLTGCYKIEWKHHSAQYTGDLQGDLHECNEFKKTRVPPFKSPPYDTGDPKRLESLQGYNSAMADKDVQALAKSGLLAYEPQQLLSHCMDYKGYQGKRVQTTAGVILPLGAIAAGAFILVAGFAFVEAAGEAVDSLGAMGNQ